MGDAAVVERPWLQDLLSRVSLGANGLPAIDVPSAPERKFWFGSRAP
jgi:hypothetical protein